VQATRPTEAERFWAKVRKTDTCWIWTAANNGRKGYGVFYPAAGKIYAHRWAYVDTYGEIPSGLVVDHLCCNVRCVNPDHLEAVTNRENLMRADIGPRNAAHNRERAARRRLALA